MSEDPEANRLSDEDTISLIDLVAVVLRHRKLLLWSVICALSVAIIVNFVYPAYKIGKAEREQIAEATTTFMLSSALKAILGEGESSNYILQTLNDPVNILAALRAAGYDELEDKSRIDASVSEDKAIFAVRRRILQNKAQSGKILKQDQTVYRVALSGGVGTISYYDRDSNKAQLFLGEISRIVSANLSEYIHPFALNKIDAFENLLLIEKPTEVVGITIVQGYEPYSLIKTYLTEQASPITVLREPFVMKAEIDKKAIQRDIQKKGLILIFCVFFLAILIAFIMQYVENVKADPAAMEKLRLALKKRKA